MLLAQTFLAAFWVWQTCATRLDARVKLALVPAVCWGVTFLEPRMLTALAAAGLLGLFYQIIKPSSNAPGSRQVRANVRAPKI